VLVNAQTGTEWFQRLMAAAAAVCFPNGRIRYLDVNGRPGTPLVPQAALYFGPSAERFTASFAAFGHCVPLGDKALAVSRKPHAVLTSKRAGCHNRPASRAVPALRSLRPCR
jgi:hypothetical protein